MSSRPRAGLYEGFAAVWPQLTDDVGYAERINAMPKYVASRTLEGPLEGNATLIEGISVSRWPR